MGLEFTHMPDREGPAVYLLGDAMLETKLQALGTAIDAATPEETQVVYLDVHGEDGASVVDFYDIQESSLPAVLIVMDDDTIYKSWFGIDLPTVEDVLYDLRSITGAGA